MFITLCNRADSTVTAYGAISVLNTAEDKKVTSGPELLLLRGRGIKHDPSMGSEVNKLLHTRWKLPWAFLLFILLLWPRKGRSTIPIHTTSSSNLANIMSQQFRRLISDKINLTPMHTGYCLGFFSCCKTKNPNKGNLREKGFTWSSIPVSSLSLQGKQGNRNSNQLVTLHPQSRAESDELTPESPV